MRQFTFPRMRTALVALCSMSLLAVVLVYTQHVSAIDQDILKLNRIVQTNKVNTAATMIFKEGRDMIEAQNWSKAAQKFNEFIKGYPKEKDVDAALYWYGYALQKQGLKEDAATPLRRLIERFPGSSWRREAEALLVMMGYQNIVADFKNNDDCEIKVLALQSLFQADEDRAIAIVTDSLKAGSTNCPGFQSAAVSLLGSHGGARAVPILLDIARGNGDLKLRLTAVKRLGEQHSEQVSDELIKLYEDAGIKRERVLIKLASTWEGVRAAEVLQKEGINCNMTLLFAPAQAAAAAEAGAKLISPFVGRIYDWYKKSAGAEWDEVKNGGANDPGVQSVRKIYAYYKKFGHNTEVMGASFRTVGQITELAGCDLLTISPDLLKKLADSNDKVERKLSPELVANEPIQKIAVDEPTFRFLVNDDAMATEKLAEGIRTFAADAVKLEKVIAALQ